MNACMASCLKGILEKCHLILEVIGKGIQKIDQNLIAYLASILTYEEAFLNIYWCFFNDEKPLVWAKHCGKANGMFFAVIIIVIIIVAASSFRFFQILQFLSFL